jgi:Ni/Co efflux regulator RcnB
MNTSLSLMGACLLSAMAVSVVAAPDPNLQTEQDKLNKQVIEKPFSVDETDDKYHARERDHERRHKKHHHRDRHDDWDDASR